MAFNETFYNFSANSLQGKQILMKTYVSHVKLVVNTASECGFTPQYAGLQALYEKYKDQRFVVLGFPCNQFGGQEPGSAEDIELNCQLNYGVTFPMFDKINVNGKKAHPIYQWLKNEKKGLLGGRIPWNFTKFLIDRSGNVVGRFGPQTTPKKLEARIEELLAQEVELSF